MVCYTHSFAKVWLRHMGNEITINGRNFFAERVHSIQNKFDISPLKSFIYLGEPLIEEEEMDEITQLSFTDMKRKFGLTVYKIPVGKKGWKKLQKDILIIAKKAPGIPDEISEKTFSNRQLKIEWSKAEGWIRGVGENFGTTDGQFSTGGITPKVYYTHRKVVPHNKIIDDTINYEELSDDIVDEWLGKKKKKYTKHKIKEIPYMITEEGLLLCIQWSKVMQKWIAVGKTRGGKSFALNRWMGCVFYIWQDRVGLLNDSLNQFYDLSLKQNLTAFIKELNRVGNVRKNLPTVNLYMSCPELKMNYTDERVSYRLVIDFTDFLKRWDYFAFGVDKWKIGAPFKYVSDEVIKEMSKKDNAKDIKQYLIAKFTELQGDGRDLEKGKMAMIMKWSAAIDKVLSDQFTSNLFSNEETTAPYWHLKYSDGKQLHGHPFIVSLEAGLVPVVNNYLAKNRPIAIKQMADLINQLIAHQMRVDKKKRIWLNIDELKDFFKHKKGNVLYVALDEVFTQGAFNNIGIFGSVQEYSQLTNAMRNNLTHLLIFDMPSKDERKKAAADLDLDKERMEYLYNLKPHQCLLATKERVVLYDKDGRRKVVQGGIWKGKIIPPITHHKDTGE